MPTGPAYLSWSGGKDSALALHRLLAEPQGLRVTHLLATVSEEYGRVSMHGLRRSLLREQARSLGLELIELPLPDPCPMERYELIMLEAMRRAIECGVRTVVFGDIFLTDVREYRQERLAAVGMEAVFPLWGRDTGDLAREFMAAGFKARVAAVDAHQGLDDSFLGRPFDLSFLAGLPSGVDPCGERGEFHTFVHDGPIFTWPIRHRLGRIESRGRFRYQEFVPVRSPARRSRPTCPGGSGPP